MFYDDYEDFDVPYYNYPDFDSDWAQEVYCDNFDDDICFDDDIEMFFED
jgi:hypothetical protein